MQYCHDLFSEDGQVCFVDYKTGAFECDVDTRELNHVWKRPLCHCHTIDRMLWVGDNTPYVWAQRPCETMFFDREIGREWLCNRAKCAIFDFCVKLKLTFCQLLEL
ncbi:MAG: hypothetical protein KIG65_09335 [Eubacteriales bacterium]|nr:hypothetical protein [Eubacteriales bacterium]